MNDNHCLTITTRSGKATVDPSMSVVDEIWDIYDDIDNKLKAKRKFW